MDTNSFIAGFGAAAALFAFLIVVSSGKVSKKTPVPSEEAEVEVSQPVVVYPRGVPQVSLILKSDTGRPITHAELDKNLAGVSELLNYIARNVSEK